MAGLGSPLACIYGLSKGGVRAFTKAMALEFAELVLDGGYTAR